MAASVYRQDGPRERLPVDAQPVLFSEADARRAPWLKGPGSDRQRVVRSSSATAPITRVAPATAPGQIGSPRIVVPIPAATSGGA